MRSLALMAGAAVVALAAPASAQVLGGISGNVGAGASVRTGDLGVRDTVGATRDFARDTVGDARRAATQGDHAVSASASVSTDADAGVSSDGATIGMDAQVGARVRARNGRTLGHLIGFSAATAERAAHALVHSADGAVRAVEASRLSVEATGDVRSDMSEREFRRAPRQDDRRYHAQ